MKLTIIAVILGFYCCGCYANPKRCVCVQNPEVSSSILTGFHPCDHEQAQGLLEDPEILVPEEIQPFLTTGGASYVGPRPRKNLFNFQNPRQSEYELGEYNGDTENRFKQENALRTRNSLLELFELPKRGNSGEPILTTGQLSPVTRRPGKRLQKPRKSEYELREYNSDIENRFKQEINVLRTLLGLFELPKRGNSSEPILQPGQLSLVITRTGKRREMSRIEVEEGNGGSEEELPRLYTGTASETNPRIIRFRRRFFRPDIRLPQIITEPKFTAHVRDGDYEYEL